MLRAVAAGSTPSGGSTLSFTDTSGTPGNATANTPRGKSAIAAGVASCTITNNLCKTTSSVYVTLNGLDTTLTSISVVPANGSFAVTGNAAATANVPFSWLVQN